MLEKGSVERLEDGLKRIRSRGGKINIPAFPPTNASEGALPIDPDFQKKRKVSSRHNGHDVWGPVEPPEKLGIHGTNVAVDWDICEADGICIEVCPVSMYEWAETPGHRTSERKSDPIREGDCIQCLVCESQCLVQAIKISTGPS